jgi:hypothetical protein
MHKNSKKGQTQLQWIIAQEVYSAFKLLTGLASPARIA